MLAFRWPSFRLLLTCIASGILTATLAVTTVPAILAQEPVRIDPVTDAELPGLDQFVSGHVGSDHDEAVVVDTYPGDDAYIGANLFTPPAPAAAQPSRNTRRVATVGDVAAPQARRRSFAGRGSGTSARAAVRWRA